MNIHLLTIGDEILIGQIVDTNSSWMSQELNLHGYSVNGKSSVGDTRDAILDGIEYATKHADVVIITGGLGPTKDDITKKTLADLFNSGMSYQPDVYERIAAFYEKAGRPVSESATLQATLPDKAEILPNKVGTASGMWFERDGKVCISLPGVPFEMQYLMQKQVIPRLLERFPGKPIVHRTLLTACEGESNIAKRLEGFEDTLPTHIKLAYLPSLAQVRLRLTGVLEGAQGPNALKDLQDEMDVKTAELSALLPDIVYGKEQESLEEVVGKLLLAQNKTFGTAESCTGGYIAHLITRIPGSSAYYPGSVVSYSYDLKNGLLGVQKETLEKEGAVSERAVIEMAQGALKTLGVDVSLSVSGIAGPGGGTPDKPVGTVWMAVADKDRVVTQRHTFWRDREKNIQLTSVYALNMVRKFLLEAL